MNLFVLIDLRPTSSAPSGLPYLLVTSSWQYHPQNYFQFLSICLLSQFLSMSIKFIPRTLKLSPLLLQILAEFLLSPPELHILLFHSCSPVPILMVKTFKFCSPGRRREGRLKEKFLTLILGNLTEKQPSTRCRN